jgi:type II secretory pathway predicted ATPase ExeA
MAHSQDEKARLARLKLPGDEAVRGRFERWMAQTGWNDADVADAITKADGCSYSRAAVNLYRLGRYPGAENPANTLALRAALLALMDANPTALERQARGTLYHTESYRKFRAAGYKAMERGWAYCIDGAPGTQKSYLSLSLCRELEATEAGKNGHGRAALYVRCRPRMSRRDLLTEISLAAGIVARGYIGQMVRKLRHFFAARRVLLILDEGQQLDNAALETVRELLDEPPYFGLLLVGSHDLQRKFQQLELEQWHSRLQNVIELQGLTEAELRTIWEREVGPISERKFKELVGFCRVRDVRKRDTWYLSARRLFFAIEQAKA